MNFNQTGNSTHTEADMEGEENGYQMTEQYLQQQR